MPGGTGLGFFGGLVAVATLILIVLTWSFWSMVGTGIYNFTERFVYAIEVGQAERRWRMSGRGESFNDPADVGFRSEAAAVRRQNDHEGCYWDNGYRWCLMDRRNDNTCVTYQGQLACITE